MKQNEGSSILNIALSIFSVVLIVLGLVFIYLGLKDVLGVSTQNTGVVTDNSTGDINIGISITKAPVKPTNSTEKPTAQQKALQTQEKIRTTGKWIAINYVKGDISPGDYTVKQGDTLWEIAEAVYGDGFQWTKILDANKAKIGKLPSGEQALIFPGQVLVIP
jgi:hypothetical protein